MCIQHNCRYTCGCLKQERFMQCDAHVGIDRRCQTITPITIAVATHMCATDLFPVRANNVGSEIELGSQSDISDAVGGAEGTDSQG